MFLEGFIEQDEEVYSNSFFARLAKIWICSKYCLSLQAVINNRSIWVKI